MGRRPQPQSPSTVTFVAAWERGDGHEQIAVAAPQSSAMLILLDIWHTHEKRNPGHVVQMERWNIAPAPPAVWGERRNACLEIEPRGEAD
ncbi:MAG: hypothetical protein MK365_16015 [Vicinamibacterales bacterium]|nr:hypothetical protein [Vicinamibacterales bacterium]